MAKRKPYTRRQRGRMRLVALREAAVRDRAQRAWERKDRLYAQTVDAMLEGVQDA